MKKITFLLILTGILLTSSFISVSAYCYDCYGNYGGNYGNYRYNNNYNFAQNSYSTSYSYNQPFGHSYYYQPFGFSSYGGYNYNQPSSYYNQPISFSSSITSTSYKDYYNQRIYDTQYRYDSPYTHGITYRTKVYDSDGYLVQTSRSNSGYSYGY